MTYRDIVRKEVEKLVLKKSQVRSDSERSYIDWIIGQLIADLRDYETSGYEKWLREPFDEAWKRYQRQVSPFYNLDEFLRQFFGW